MLCKDVMAAIEGSYARRYAMEWDNVGLLVGRDDKEIERIYLALDAIDEVIAEASKCGADLLVTHHPLIFGGMKQITNQDFIGRRVLELARRDISYYAMHTNYDVVRMAGLAADLLGLLRQEVLEVTCEESEESLGIGRIGYSEEPMALKECCERVKKVFSLEAVRAFGDPKRQVCRVAVCPGSGKSVLRDALRKGADVLITGDIGHHEGIDAVAQGMAVIDAGHYGMEYIFVEDMRRFLTERLPGAEVLGAPVSHPYVSV